MQGFGDITKVKELNRRLLYTGMMLLIYRLGVHVPMTGIDGSALVSLFQDRGGSLFGMLNLFTGGALQNASIFALGVMPYITASIIMQLATVVVPAVERWSREGEVGRRRINQMTRYGTVLLCFFQGSFLATALQKQIAPGGVPIVADPGLDFVLSTALSITAGTAFLMWMGEQIQERGIGNGMSLIIFTGIVAGFIPAAGQTFTLVRTEQIGLIAILLVLLVMGAFIAAIIFMERSHRRIPVQYAKRMVGRKVYGGVTSHLPLRINTAGVIPPIFASALLTLPSTFGLGQTSGTWAMLADPMGGLHNLLYIVLIIVFAYFYTAVAFNPKDVADSIKRQGGFVPGKRPGKATADYIEYVLSRITFVGALYLSAICVLPVLLISLANVPFYFGGTSLLIVVGVVLDTVGQMESHLIARNYEGFTGPGGPRIRGRRG